VSWGRLKIGADSTPIKKPGKSFIEDMLFGDEEEKKQAEASDETPDEEPNDEEEI
jgi:hypothetical protein